MCGSYLSSADFDIQLAVRPIDASFQPAASLSSGGLPLISKAVDLPSKQFSIPYLLCGGRCDGRCGAKPITST